MWFGKKTRVSGLAALLVAAMLASNTPAFAVDIAIGSGGRNLTRDHLIDLQILESRALRREYQNQQRQFRAEDRQLNGVGSRTLDGPQMQGNCRVQSLGNKALSTCR